MRGRHASDDLGPFLRELLGMLAVIVAVGVLVFGGIYLLSRLDARGAEVDAGPTTSRSRVAASTVPSAGPAESAASRPGATATSPPSIRAATTTSSATTTTTREVRPPGEVRVLVLNSIGQDGLASQVGAELAVLGYQTIEPANYQPRLDQTRVFYNDGFEGEAHQLAISFPDALVEPSEEIFDTGADIVVVLGSSYQR
ncbi:MAG: LytR C-terminal domain-containing protein [Acidimicrobiia bacterium]